MGEAWSWAREALLASGLIATLIAVLVLMTGSWPPMVVIESGSMMPVSYTHLTLPTTPYV